MEASFTSPASKYSNTSYHNSPPSRWSNYLSSRKGLELRHLSSEAYPVSVREIGTFFNSKDYNVISHKSVFTWYDNDKEPDRIFSRESELTSYAKSKSPGALVRWSETISDSNAILTAAYGSGTAFYLIALQEIRQGEEIILFNPTSMVATLTVTPAKKRTLENISPQKVSPPSKASKASSPENLSASLQKSVTKMEMQPRSPVRNTPSSSQNLEPSFGISDSISDEDVQQFRFKSPFKDLVKIQEAVTEDLINEYSPPEKGNVDFDAFEDLEEEGQGTMELSPKPQKVTFKFVRPKASYLTEFREPDSVSPDSDDTVEAQQIADALPDRVSPKNCTSFPTGDTGITPRNSPEQKRIGMLSPENSSEEGEEGGGDSEDSITIHQITSWQESPTEEQLDSWAKTMRESLRSEGILQSPSIDENKEQKELPNPPPLKKPTEIDTTRGLSSSNPIALDDDSEEVLAGPSAEALRMTNPHAKTRFIKSKESTAFDDDFDLSEGTYIQEIDVPSGDIVGYNLSQVLRDMDHGSEEDSDSYLTPIKIHTLKEHESEEEGSDSYLTPPGIQMTEEEIKVMLNALSPGIVDMPRSKADILPKKLIFTEEGEETRQVKLGLSDETLSQENIERESESAILQDLKRVKVIQVQDRKKSSRSVRKPMERDLASYRLTKRRSLEPTNLIPSESGAKIMLTLKDIRDRMHLICNIRESNKRLESSGNGSYQTLSIANIEKFLACMVSVFRMDKFSRFLDLGSGYGNIVFQAALTWHLQASHGIDIGLQGMGYTRDNDLIIPLDKVIYYCSILTKASVALIPEVKEQMNKVLFYFGDANSYVIRDYTHVISFNNLWDCGDFHGIVDQMLDPNSKLVAFGSTKDLHKIQPRPVSLTVLERDVRADQKLIETMKVAFTLIQTVSLPGSTNGGFTFTMYFYVRTAQAKIYQGLPVDFFDTEYSNTIKAKIYKKDAALDNNFHMNSLNTNEIREQKTETGQTLSPAQHSKNSMGKGSRRKADTGEDACTVS